MSVFDNTYTGTLVDDAMEPCIMIDKRTQGSEYGGTRPVWVDGAPFDAAFVFNDSMPAKIASTQGVTDRYTVYTHKNVTLGFHDVFRRVSDGMIFRVTTNGKEKKTPKSAALNLSVVSAEEWELTDD